MRSKSPWSARLVSPTRPSKPSCCRPYDGLPSPSKRFLAAFLLGLCLLHPGREVRGLLHSCIPPENLKVSAQSVSTALEGHRTFRSRVDGLRGNPAVSLPLG
ncbi:hypothetical protein RB7626 [Rhodopirellula baltica SH 1]|uniref:Uncharacterized protein n=1 Tax=Rhodopirellula baltica (strain DSM 10527 / NCIMB 13988 / SH1) TaxID=243090 RepID=Q7UNE4_RHOBA|nr:hypothetical protein RB7626 [Rhodopirellula baltica SH 1]